MGAAAYPDPRAILRDRSLTRAEKIERLRRACEDARQLEVANDDGMRGEVRSSNLGEFQEALRELEAENVAASRAPGIQE